MACLWGHAQANTEIINFEAVESELIATDAFLPCETLSSSSSTRHMVLTPASPTMPQRHACDIRVLCSEAPGDTPSSRPPDCAHEAWVLLELDDPLWKDFRKFTLRISWPASHPAAFYVETMPAAAAVLASKQLNETASATDKDAGGADRVQTRRQYARIRAVNTGVRPSPSAHFGPVEVPFALLLEPLYLGIVPGSVLPILGLLLPVIILAWFLVTPRAQYFISQIAEDVRSEDAARQKGD